MQQDIIENHFKSGNLSQALNDLENAEPSAWRDAFKLRCLRSMGRGADASSFATQLLNTLNSEGQSYEVNIAERNHQLRYIALVYSEYGHAKEACEILRSLCSDNPQVAALHREYAFALTNDMQFDDAELQLNLALELQPNSANTHALLARIYCLTGRVRAGINSYSKAATLKPDNAKYIQRLLYWSNFSEYTTQQSNYQLAALWASRAHPIGRVDRLDETNDSRSAAPDRQLRVGLVSPNFYAHTTSFFILPLLNGLNRSDFQIVAYSDTKKLDSVSSSIGNLCDEWHDTAKLSTRALSTQIVDDQIDILIDLAGHGSDNRLDLFAQQVAPIQLSWLNYPASSGLHTINCRITDNIADPAGLNEEFFTEKPLRLPNGLLCYQPSDNAPDILPKTDTQGIRFGSFNMLAKVSNLTLDCWAAVLHAVPHSTLYLKRRELSHKGAGDFLISEFAERGIAAERIILKTSRGKIEQHLNEYNQVDIALDTTPYNGAKTALEALWMGVPVISLSGQTHASRLTASVLRRLNMDSFATKSMVEFVDKTVELSNDNETRQQLAKTLRDNMRNSALLNANQFGREFGTALRKQWRSWCDQQNNSQQN